MFFAKKPDPNQLIIDEIQKIIMLFLEEDNWCKRALARDKSGEQLFDPWSKEAVQWDVYGALYAFDASPKTVEYLQRRAKTWGYSDIDRLNDLNEHFYLMQFLKESLNLLGASYKVTYKDGDTL